MLRTYAITPKTPEGGQDTDHQGSAAGLFVYQNAPAFRGGQIRLDDSRSATA